MNAALFDHRFRSASASCVVLSLALYSCAPKLDEPRGNPAFSIGGIWTDQNGRARSLTEFKGHPAILAYFFTTCPTICPRIVADMKNLEESLSPSTREGVKFILISVDPETDTTERLKAYAGRVGLSDDRWVLLRPNRADLSALAASMYVGVAGTGIDILHSSSIFVLDQEGFARLRSSNYIAGKRTLVRAAEYLVQEAEKGKKRDR